MLCVPVPTLNATILILHNLLNNQPQNSALLPVACAGLVHVRASFVTRGNFSDTPALIPRIIPRILTATMSYPRFPQVGCLDLRETGEAPQTARRPMDCRAERMPVLHNYIASRAWAPAPNPSDG